MSLAFWLVFLHAVKINCANCEVYIYVHEHMHDKHTYCIYSIINAAVIMFSNGEGLVF